MFEKKGRLLQPEKRVSVSSEDLIAADPAYRSRYGIPRSSTQKKSEADGRTQLDFDFPVKWEMKFAKCVGRTRFFGSTRKIKPS
jgi:hypothetical protein